MNEQKLATKSMKMTSPTPFSQINETYPADCLELASVDSHNSIGIERKENINKIDFCIKTFLGAIYFDVIS